jgi:hypothetical protein
MAEMVTDDLYDDYCLYSYHRIIYVTDNNDPAVEMVIRVLRKEG